MNVLHIRIRFTASLNLVKNDHVRWLIQPCFIMSENMEYGVPFPVKV